MKMSSEINFTVTSSFLGNFRVKPYFNTQGGGRDFLHTTLKLTLPLGFSDLPTARHCVSIRSEMQKFHTEEKNCYNNVLDRKKKIMSS